jgi:hypothetical protein
MIERRAAVGIAVACVLAVSAFGAATAAGQSTWQTCKPSGAPFGFSDAHCVNKGAGWIHEVVPVGGFPPTLATFTNVSTAVATTASTPWKLRGTIAGVEAEVECTEVNGSGSIENSAETGASASFVLENAGCTVTKPAGKGCVISGGKFSSEKVSATTAGLEAGEVEVAPASGTTLLSVKIESCSISGLNKTFPVTGSYRVAPGGATWATSHEVTTARKSLQLGGNTAGINSAVTMKMAGGGNAITLT